MQDIVDGFPGDKKIIVVFVLGEYRLPYNRIMSSTQLVWLNIIL